MGLVHNGGGLITVRFFLGVAEAGLFPGVNVRPLTSRLCSSNRS
jgi:hypothetical protein